MTPAESPFDPVLWTPRRALSFARGLYHVAACDGVSAAETELMSRFLALTGAPTDLNSLLATPYDFTEARRDLDSVWLRRLMVRASRCLAELDGGLTDEERDALRAMGLGLGVGERLAMAPAELSGAQPGEILAWLTSQLIDWIAWDDEAQRAWFWPHPRGSLALAPGAKIIVSRGQALVVHLDSTPLDVLPDGVHEVSPAALPGLAAAAGWHDERTPVAAHLTFVSMGVSDNLRWGTVDPIPVPESQGSSELVPLRAFGRFSMRVADAGRAFARFCRSGALNAEDFEARVRRMAAGRFAEALRVLAQTEGLGADRVLTEQGLVVERARPHIERAFTEAGLGVRRFELESLTGPLELEIHTTRGGRPLMSGGFANPTHGTGVAPDAEHSCPRCLGSVTPQARFCPQCGAPQRRPCGQCAQEVSVRARFCPNCGTSQTTP